MIRHILYILLGLSVMACITGIGIFIAWIPGSVLLDLGIAAGIAAGIAVILMVAWIIGFSLIEGDI